MHIHQCAGQVDLDPDCLDFMLLIGPMKYNCVWNTSKREAGIYGAVSIETGFLCTLFVLLTFFNYASKTKNWRNSTDFSTDIDIVRKAETAVLVTLKSSLRIESSLISDGKGG